MSDILRSVKKKISLNSQISIIDNQKVLIENCKSVLEVNENLVRILSSDFEINVWGNDLNLTNYSSNAVSVNGKIKSMEIIERRKQCD